ncbi:KxYKxGKxW signal peptide domain-containing protein, partial [Lacticaseibacillus porcinae]|uniref:KxYKxGKxW signal peptide domain-containing protein n=1 Tax=Lacticaseibacillus porcinae TaxID=1123687 RepID=UPI0013DDD31A
MRQHMTDEKVHYKLYKDGKNWVPASMATGIAIPVALFSAAFLSPNQGVQATSDDKGYSYPEVAVEANWAPDVAKILPDAFKDGELYDATVNGHSSVTVNGDQMKIIEAAGMKLTLKDDRWELAPASDRNKVDFNTVLQGIGFPTAAIAAVNGGATDGQDIQTIISFVQSHGIQTMNGGVTSSTNGGVQNTLLSGSGLDMGGSRNVSATTKPIGSTKYSSIVSGPLNKLGPDNGSPAGNTLIADGGTLQGTTSLPNSLVDVCNRFDFTDGSFAQAMGSLRNAVEKINSYLTTVSSPDSVQVKDQYDQGLGHFDFSKATQDSNGDYIFVLNSDAFTPAGMLRVDFSHQEAYKGGNVILLVTGTSSLNFSGQADTFSTNSSFIKNGHLFVAIPNGNEINFGNSGTDKTNEVNLLAPTSTINSEEVGANGLVGVINGKANPSSPIDGGGNGYVNPGDGTDTLTPTDDHTQTPPAGDPKQTTPPTDTNTTPEGGGNTTTPETSKSKTITVNQKITTSVSNSGKIKPSDIPVGDLPTNTQTKSTSFTATVKDDGTVSYTNADGSIPEDALFDDVPVDTTTKIGDTTYTVQVTGTLTDNSGLEEDTLDAKAVTDQIGQATDGTTLNWNIAVVYFPSSTSKSGTLTVTDHVDYQFDLDDDDSDEKLLPDDFDRTATLTYTQKTDSQGNKSYSDWAVTSGLKLFEVPILKGYQVELEDGATNNAPLTDAALLNMVENAPDPLAMTDTYTDIVYTPIPQIDQNKPDNHKQDDGPRVKTQVPTDKTPFTTGENLQKQSDLHQLDDGVQVKTQVPTGNTPHTYGDNLHKLDTGVQVKTQVPTDKTPFTTGENLQKQSDLHQLDDGVQVKTQVPTGNTPHTYGDNLHKLDTGVQVKTQVPTDNTPFTTGENLQKQSDLHQLDDGVQVKTQVPTGNTPHTYGDNLHKLDT